MFKNAENYFDLNVKGGCFRPGDFNDIICFLLVLFLGV